MSAMECSNHCGPIYQRDGKWWCLNNYCENSYFFDHRKITKAEVRYTTEDGDIHTVIIDIAIHPILSIESIRIGGITVAPENIAVKVVENSL